MKLRITPMQEKDIKRLHAAFVAQGWTKPLDILKGYYQRQTDGELQVYVARGEKSLPFGYAVLLPGTKEGPFKGMDMPMVSDLNVFEPYRRQGVASCILKAMEKDCIAKGKNICLGVGLHPGYGAAQRLYVISGYIPDGSGAWADNRPSTPNAACMNDDSLVLYLSKQLV